LISIGDYWGFSSPINTVQMSHAFSGSCSSPDHLILQ